jgi:hypothetical protein
VTELSPGVYDFLAPDANKCASATWIIAGPVSIRRGPIPSNGCFDRQHEFDMEWRDQVWPPLSVPGNYTVTLKLSVGGLAGESTQAFVVP